MPSHFKLIYLNFSEESLEFAAPDPGGDVESGSGSDYVFVFKLKWSPSFLLVFRKSVDQLVVVVVAIFQPY